MKNHFYNLSLLIAKALAHGVDSEETEKAIRQDATNMYVETQLKQLKERLIAKVTKVAKDKKIILGQNGYENVPILFEEVEVVKLINEQD